MVSIVYRTAARVVWRFFQSSTSFSRLRVSSRSLATSDAECAVIDGNSLAAQYLAKEPHAQKIRNFGQIRRKGQYVFNGSAYQERPIGDEKGTRSAHITRLGHRPRYRLKPATGHESACQNALCCDVHQSGTLNLRAVYKKVNSMAYKSFK
jgi:hypothetical protein